MNKIKLPLEIVMFFENREIYDLSIDQIDFNVPISLNDFKGINLERHSLWAKQSQPIVREFLSSLLASSIEKIRRMVGFLENRVNIWRVIKNDFYQEWRAVKCRAFVENIYDLALNQDVLKTVVGRFLKVSDALNYSMPEYIDKYYLKRIKSLKDNKGVEHLKEIFLNVVSIEKRFHEQILLDLKQIQEYYYEFTV